MTTDTTTRLPDPATRPAQPLAYSADPHHDDGAPLPAHYTWTAAAVLAVTGFALAALLAVAAVAVLGNHHAAPATPTPPAASPSAVPAPPPPPVTAQPDTTPPAQPSAAPAPPPVIDPLTVTDHRFLAQLDRDDIPPRNPGTEGSAIATAEAICRALGSGQTVAQVNGVMSARWLTQAQASAYIDDAVEFYCPHAAR